MDLGADSLEAGSAFPRDDGKSGLAGHAERDASSPKGNEDSHEATITFGRPGEEHRDFRWPHVVLMDKVQNGSPSSIAISEDGLKIAVGFESGLVLIWDVDRDALMYMFRHNDNIPSVAFSPLSTHLASGSSDCSVTLWSMETGLQECHLTTAHESEVWCLTFSPDETTLVTGSVDASIKFWKVEDLLRGIEEPYLVNKTEDKLSAIQIVRFTPDGSRIISFSDCVGSIWDGHSGSLEHRMRGHRCHIWDLAISHKGDRAATGSEDHTARIWKVESGKEIIRIQERNGSVRSVQFSPDDKFLVSGSYDRTVKVHNTSTGDCIHILVESFGVRTVAYSLTGDFIISGSRKGTLKIWDATKGKQLAEIKGHTAKVNAILFHH
ncbi:hypothetical protein NLI96_g7804 [Meripilus lineatus]|uniref:Uncharacterized protein n=1 Tax=Meripilus lineatus TaxID=2056292 RepID=A0AAD5V0N7_9APHY|nr:hypothetical protein NLI96_g7804 [Physisporinus lineatus]